MAELGKSLVALDRHGSINLSGIANIPGPEAPQDFICFSESSSILTIEP